MMKFHEQIISELLEDPNGGLVVLSSGLNLAKLLSSLICLHDRSQGTLLFLAPPNPLKTRIHHNISLPSDWVSEVTAELPAHQRLSIYASGGVCFITPRILIVDLLTGKVPVSSIAGVVLPCVHSLSETSTEAFIVRVLKSQAIARPLTVPLYVRAFTDKPYAMVSGFAKTERIMKALYIRRLHLWPRFQVCVSHELEADPPEVVDVRVPMSKYMVGIQKAIVEVMDTCLKEMRKTNKVDVDDLTVENGLFKSFDEIVRRQLDPIWHNVGKRTKQLVSDLKTLRKLLDYLVRYDPVSFLKYLDTLRVSESVRSVWIFAESSFKIFGYAKKRVYQVGLESSNEHAAAESRSGPKKKRKLLRSDDKEDEASGATTSSANGGLTLIKVLEEPPKWKLLRDILEEIHEERRKLAVSRGSQIARDDIANGIVLIACKDERSCMQLEDCIEHFSQKVLQEEWENYLLSKVELRSLAVPHKKKAKGRAKETKGVGVLDGVIPVTTVQNVEVSNVNKQENDALLAAASEVRNRMKGECGVINQVSSDVVSDGKSKKMMKRRNQDTDSSLKKIDSDKTMPNTVESCSNSAIRDAVNKSKASVIADSGDKKFPSNNSEEHGATRSDSEKQIPPVYFYAQEREQPILDILKPSVIIVYQPDIAFVREIELYKAEHQVHTLKVYFLFYDESTEVQKFEASIRRENSAFESLIRQKSLMVIPVDQNGQCLGPNPSTDIGASSSQNSLTRKAGGRKDSVKEMQVIVDMREFMSSLPNVLHQKGMRIIPVTLEVGDYILSPSICIERKSIQDLFMSFTSGRLYHQAEMMVRYYRSPVLLIEFSQDKSFSFMSASDVGDDVTPTSIISKLSLLSLHFPRLRIIWSRSLHATADIFASLKANQDEPDPAKAIRVGVPSEEGIIENDVRAENYNTSAVELLRRLPGVTDSNYRAIMDRCTSLAELSLLPVEKLAEVMGGQKAAQILRDFLDAKYPVLQ